ncbi:MAG TPA: alpha/beta hydrolase [Alphaproteobacteria bacterium]|nr:alpha/beta hydrolase [Alphaproteobacteria bacterium]
MATIEHNTLSVGGIPIHYARCGSGQPLLLLHGWPEFWLTWEPVMQRLADRFDVIAPDLRGFGQSGHPDPAPSKEVGADVHLKDFVGLLDALKLDRVGVVSHDVGAYVGQLFGRHYPERCSGLFFFNVPYPGVGNRWTQPDHIAEIWYQSFNQQPFAAQFVGASRDTCRAYFSHLLNRWSAKPGAFDDAMEDWVDNFLSHGNLQGGFNWYLSNHAARIAIMKGNVPPAPPIAVKTKVCWGAEDSVIKAEWGDRLGEYFTDLDFSPMPGVGHFPHKEDPDRAAAAIAGFFGENSNE